MSLQNTHGLAYGTSRPTGSGDGCHLQHEHVDFTGTPHNWNCEARSYWRAASISNTMAQRRSSRRTPSPSAPPPRRTTGRRAVRPHAEIKLCRHEDNYAHAHKAFVDKEQARTLKHPCRPSIQDYRGVHARKSLEEQPHRVPPHFECARAGRENTKSKFARKCRADRSFRCHWYDDPEDAHCIHIWPQLLASLRCIQRQLRLTSAPRECGKIQHSVTQVQI